MKREPDHLKSIKGTARADRSKSAPVSVSSIPKKMPFVPAKANSFYTQLAEHLKDHGALAEVDSFMLSIVAHSYNIFMMYAKQCNNSAGCIQEFKNGTGNVSPAYTIVKTERKFLMDSFAQLGVGQQSREKILAFLNSLKPEDKEDMIASLLKTG